jgi:hypothetical protein
MSLFLSISMDEEQCQLVLENVDVVAMGYQLMLTCFPSFLAMR